MRRACCFTSGSSSPAASQTLPEGPVRLAAVTPATVSCLLCLLTSSLSTAPGPRSGSGALPSSGLEDGLASVVPGEDWPKAINPWKHQLVSTYPFLVNHHSYRAYALAANFHSEGRYKKPAWNNTFRWPYTEVFPSA